MQLNLVKLTLKCTIRHFYAHEVRIKVVSCQLSVVNDQLAAISWEVR
jgi:hypothetical protein